MQSRIDCGRWTVIFQPQKHGQRPAIAQSIEDGPPLSSICHLRNSAVEYLIKYSNTYAVSEWNRHTTKLVTGGDRAHMLDSSWQWH